MMHTAVHWSNRATECYALAECMGDPGAKGMMLRLASDYDRMAEMARELDEAIKFAEAISIATRIGRS